MLAAFSFLAPLALFGLLALPVIWWLLRFTPPKPELVRFPPLRLLLDLMPKEEQPDKTPWWLMALRLALAALVILGVSHPLSAPDRRAPGGSAPLLLVIDNGWAAAQSWPDRIALAKELIGAAGEVALAGTAPSGRIQDLKLRSARTAVNDLGAWAPKAMNVNRAGLLDQLKAAYGAAPALRVAWLSDGLDDGAAEAFAAGLKGLASGSAALEVYAPALADLPAALRVPVIEGSEIKISGLRAATPQTLPVTARILAGNGRSLAEVKLDFAANAGLAQAQAQLPLELRNEAARVVLGEGRNAAGVFLLDDRWRRKTVALEAGVGLEAAQPLLSPLYYVSRALEPYAEISEPSSPADLAERLKAGLSMLVLADIGVIGDEERAAINDWVERGGVLVRFAGPRLAGGEDELIPVRLREGGRALGSALSWETPQALQAFPESSPFAGLPLDNEVRVTRQVLAEPDADLPDRVWASLADGTPLVTAAKRGKGLVVLYHVTANADWSNLPLSGLFVEMLRRLTDLAPGAGGGAAAGVAAQAGQAFTPRRELTAFGGLADPAPEARPVLARDIDNANPSPEHPAGLYVRGASERAINLTMTGDALTPITGMALKGYATAPALALAPLLFALAFGLFLLDCLAALFLSGARGRVALRRGGVAVILGLLALAQPQKPVLADEAADRFALDNALKTHLAYVVTGDADVDDTSAKGLQGLSTLLTERTSVEPGAPAGLDLAKDELVFFPLIYWPVLASAETPPEAVLAKLNAYMKNGGTIFFDLREDGLGFDTLSGGPGDSTLALRRILAKLDIPALEPVPQDHVLTRAFYLLQSFPGRYDQGQLWVEAADTQGANSGNADGVTSLIIGSNDYAAAWAVDGSGQALYSPSPGGADQREMALRAGVNIVMYALTGNYKTDQVHVPALLERLGQ